MHLTRVCPCCGGEPRRAWPAVVAPFIAERALGAGPSPCRLLECEACAFRWFDVRYDPAELARLYDGYRDETYLRQRRRHEPWYTRRVNARLGGDEAINEARRRAIARFVERAIDPSEIARVLDFGGDRGQIIPETLGRERYVYDLSGVEPASGVSRIPSEEALQETSPFDLVMLCQVLEHAPEPRAQLETLRSLLRRPSGALYVEVPLERPRLEAVLRGDAAEIWLSALLSSRLALRAADLYSTFGRVAAGIVPPLGVLKAHEHLNFFHERSLRALLASAGFEVIACGPTVKPHAFGKITNVSCVARVRDR